MCTLYTREKRHDILSHTSEINFFFSPRMRKGMLISCCTKWLPIANCEWSTTMFSLIDSFLCRSSSHMRSIFKWSCNLSVVEYEYECSTEAERWRRANIELFSLFLSARPRHTSYRFSLIAFHSFSFLFCFISLMNWSTVSYVVCNMQYAVCNVCNQRKRNVPIALVLGSQLTVRFFLLLK